MTNLFGTVLLAFGVFINFGELNAARPPEPRTRHFEYEKKEVSVWLNHRRIPIHIELAQGNIPVAADDGIVFLEFKNDLYFFVTTIFDGENETIARVDNAGAYNMQGFPEPGPRPAEVRRWFGKDVNIYRDANTGRLTSMRFADRDIAPSEIECRAYKIKTHPHTFEARSVKVFQLKNGHYMGIRVQ